MKFSSLVLLAFLTLPLATQAAEITTIAPNENLVLSGIPPLPLSLQEKAGPYTNFRLGNFAGWHPQRREMLILTRFSETTQLHHVAAPGGDRHQLTFFPDAVASASFPERDASFLVLNKSSGGNEFGQNYRLDLATGALTLLTDGTAKNQPGIFNSSGQYCYTSTRRNGTDTDFYIVDPRNPDSDRLLCEVQGGGWEPLDWSPDNKTLLVLESISINQSNLWLIAQDGRKTLLSPPQTPDIPVAYGHALFGPDDQDIYFTSDQDSEFQHLCLLDRKTNTFSVLSGGIPWDVEQFDLSFDGKYLAFTTNEAGSSVLHILDTTTHALLPSPILPPGVVGSLAWHPWQNEVAFSLASARSPTDTYSWRVGDGNITRWTTSETGGLNPATFSEATPIRWKSFDQREITGFLYRPPATFTGNRPVIINIHGGPESQYRPGYLGRNNYFLNELGAAIIFPNVRGSSGYGKTFLKLDNATLREDSVRDIGALLDWITAQPGLDASHVMITGSSYGGYMTLASSAKYPNRIRCSLDVVGISNFVTFLEHTESYRRDLRRVEYGDERAPEMRAFLQTISPLTNVARITKPLFIVQGANDPRVPQNEAAQMIAALQKQKCEVWSLLAKDEGHGFIKKPNADFQFYATIAFIKQYLLRPSQITK